MLSNFFACTGCRACEQICPNSCIRMEFDKEGFLYPDTDMTSCINCSSCERVCHALIKDKTELLNDCKEQVGYFGWHKDTEIRAKSSSGGAFTAIVETFLDDKDVVFGASYNDDFTYIHHIMADKHSYQKLRKSKYVFCDPEDSYIKVKKCLQEGQKVIFSGTPCQVAGLKAYLKKDYNNLMLIDLICHGTPSVKTYESHIKHISKNSRIDNVDFRSKYFGWFCHCFKVDMEKGTYVKQLGEDFYLNRFLNNYSLRKCCYECQYSNGNHVSDITIADFWGIKDYKPELNDEKGISLVIFNNQKFLHLTQNLSVLMNFWQLDYPYYKYVYKTHEKYSLDLRDVFMKEQELFGYEKIAKRFERFLPLKKLRGKASAVKRRLVGIFAGN